LGAEAVIRRLPGTHQTLALAAFFAQAGGLIYAENQFVIHDFAESSIRES